MTYKTEMTLRHLDAWLWALKRLKRGVALSAVVIELRRAYAAIKT
jgi:hypothetical protein